MKTYPPYRLRGVTGARPHDLHRHLADYDLPCTLRSYDVYADGSKGHYSFAATPYSRQSLPMRLLLWLTTGVLGVLAGLLIDARLAWKWRRRKTKPRVVAAGADVRLLVDPMRAGWAELVLLKWAVREGWQVEPDRAWADERNPQLAARNPRAPIPFGRVRGYGAARRSGA